VVLVLDYYDQADARSVMAKYRRKGVPDSDFHSTGGLARYSFNLRNDSLHSFAKHKLVVPP